jgi:threonine/homoserine/homoserine lactone efflux protein
MDIFGFIVTVALITASGALMPGPLFFTVISHGMKSGAKGGLAFSIGHTLFEFSLVLFIAVILNFGIKPAAGESITRLSIGIIGGLALIAFGAMQVYESVKSKTANYQKESKSQKVRHPIILGLIFTGLNPFFIVWWITTGLALIEQALAIASFAGILLMYIAHVWVDYAWLTATAYLAKKGVNILGSKGYKLLVTVFGIVLICFGTYFLVSALTA